MSNIRKVNIDGKWFNVVTLNGIRYNLGQIKPRLGFRFGNWIAWHGTK